MINNMPEKENNLTKAEALKNLKKMYNKHLLDYKQYMLQVKRIEKYWDESNMVSAEEKHGGAAKEQLTGLDIQ